MNIVDIYMNNLRKDDVLNFATKKDIRLSSEELDFTYDFIKKHYKEIMQDKYKYNFNDYKDRFSKENASKISKLIDEYINYL